MSHILSRPSSARASYSTVAFCKSARRRRRTVLVHRPSVVRVDRGSGPRVRSLGKYRGPRARVSLMRTWASELIRPGSIRGRRRIAESATKVGSARGHRRDERVRRRLRGQDPGRSRKCRPWLRGHLLHVLQGPGGIDGPGPDERLGRYRRYSMLRSGNPPTFAASLCGGRPAFDGLGPAVGNLGE